MKYLTLLFCCIFPMFVSAQCPDIDDTVGPESITITKLTNGGRFPEDYSVFAEYRYTITQDRLAELWYYRTEYVWSEPREIWTCSPTRPECKPERNGQGHLSNFLTPFMSHTKTTVTLRLVVTVD